MTSNGLGVREEGQGATPMHLRNRLLVLGAILILLGYTLYSLAAPRVYHPEDVEECLNRLRQVRIDVLVFRGEQRRMPRHIQELRGALGLRYSEISCPKGGEYALHLSETSRFWVECRNHEERLALGFTGIVVRRRPLRIQPMPDGSTRRLAGK